MVKIICFDYSVAFPYNLPLTFGEWGHRWIVFEHSYGIFIFDSGLVLIIATNPQVCILQENITRHFKPL